MESSAEPLTKLEQDRLREFSRDLGKLWEAPTTRLQERKRIARCLIENVVVTVPEQSTRIQIAVHWIGGAVSRLEVPKGKRGVIDPRITNVSSEA